MKRIYHLVTIPAGQFIVAGYSNDGRKLNCTEFMDRAILGRYFAPGEYTFNRITAKEAAKSTLPRATFIGLRRFGSWQ